MLPRARVPPAAEEIHILPVMNLMGLLVAFLLLAARFMGEAAIETPLREVRAPGVDGRTEVTVAVDGEGIRVVPGVPGLAEIRLPCPADACTRPDDWDLAGLTRALGRVKDARPEDRRVVLVPAPEVPYRVLVGALDACRTDPASPTEDGAPRTLFPDPVLAGLTAGGAAP